jgi:hypothetical protein
MPHDRCPTLFGHLLAIGKWSGTCNDAWAVSTTPSMPLHAAAEPQTGGVLHVEIGDAESVCLDEVTARLDEVAHQGREGLLGRVGVADFDL